MRPAPAVELVEAYLRVNGYFVLSELEFHERTQGGYRTLTDVDVVGVRLPSCEGPVHYQGGTGAVECLLAGEVDPALGVATHRCDVIIGEVKRGEMSFNPAVVDPRVLHAVLQRIGDAAGTPLDVLVDQLVVSGRAITPLAQVRLVAFGRHGSVALGEAIHHDHMIEWLNGMLNRHRDLFEITNFSDPVLSLLALSARVDRPLAAAPDDATLTEA